MNEWISLNNRGQWLIKGEIVKNKNYLSYLNKNYFSDSNGNFYIRNGSLNFKVAYELMPYVINLYESQNLTFITHNGIEIRELTEILIDDKYNVIVKSNEISGLIKDTDLHIFLKNLVYIDNSFPKDEVILLMINHKKNLNHLGINHQGIFHEIKFESTEFDGSKNF